MISGVPRGTVLGPLLFLLYINDITGNIQSNIWLFADDCTVYRTIRSQDDSCKLQNDISSLLKWAETWQMRFNSKKCHILSISRQRNKSSPVYYLGTDVQYTPIHNIISLKIVITQVHNFTFFCVKKHLPFIHY